MRWPLLWLAALAAGGCSTRTDPATATRETLIGYWDHDAGCRSGAGTALNADGTYVMSDAYGTWSLSGDTLTIDQARPPSVQIFRARLGDSGRSRVAMAGADTLAVTWPGGSASRFYRCRRP